MTPNLLPPCPTVGTGLPEAAWLDVGSVQYRHYYAAGRHTAACGRYRDRQAVRAAWAGRGALGKPQCPSYARRLGVGTGWYS